MIIKNKKIMATDLVQELNSLDFSNYIGGPLQAAVEAQNNASLAQVNFIKEVGFESDGNALRYVKFKYEKTGSGTVTLQVPLLTMLTLPAIRIEEITIDFNAKLTSVETTKVDSTLGADASLSAGFGKMVSLKSSVSYKKSTSTSSNVEKTYSMAVHVRAVNDEMPTGLQRILDIMEANIKEGEGGEEE